MSYRFLDRIFKCPGGFGGLMKSQSAHEYFNILNEKNQKPFKEVLPYK